MMMGRKKVLTIDEQMKILARIWGRPEADDFEDGWVFLPWIPGWTNNPDERRKNWNEGPAFKWPDDAPKIKQHLIARKMDDLYFTPNVFVGDKRVAQQVGEERVLYADLDEADPRLFDPELKPTIAWMTSANEGNERFQGVWVLDGMHIGASERYGLNHRLSMYVHADMSGWDSTQVLRVPGRPNFKWDYKDDDGRPAHGELMWVRDKRFSIDWLESRLPIIPHAQVQHDVEDEEIEGIDRRAVWSRVRLKVSATVRGYMGMPERDVESGMHDRSEVLWQIERDLADAGCSIAEIIAIIKASPWNKFAGRRDELTQLRSEAIKAKGESLLRTDDDEPLEANEGRDRLPDGPLWLNELVTQPRQRPSWLVHNIWAKASVGFISGAPKSYKSYFALDMAISVATGTSFLNDSQFTTAEGPVLFLEEEDSESTVIHRVEQILEQKAPDRFWKGQITLDKAQPSRRVSGSSGTIPGMSMTLPTTPVPLALHVRKQFRISSPVDQAWLLEFVQQYKFVLVVIDTLGTTVGDIDTDKSGPLNEKVLKPLKEISEAGNCAIAVVHHNRKPNDNGRVRSGQQMLGSTALHAWVESALYIQSKETLTGRPISEVKIDRENKLAEDMKLRVRIPTMYQEKGAGELGARQLWEPEVLLGWAEETETTPEEDDSYANRHNRRMKEKMSDGSSTAGDKFVLKLNLAGGSASIEELINGGYYSAKQRGSIKLQADRAVKLGKVEFDPEDSTYHVVN